MMCVCPWNHRGNSRHGTVMVIVILMAVFIRKGAAIACSQCDSDTDPSCVDNPPAPRNCTSCQQYDRVTGDCRLFQVMPYCIIEHRYLNETLVRITRDCTPQMMRRMCTNIRDHANRVLDVCFVTCRVAGCNMNIAVSIFQNSPFQGFHLLCALVTFYCVIL